MDLLTIFILLLVIIFGIIIGSWQVVLLAIIAGNIIEELDCGASLD